MPKFRVTHGYLDDMMGTTSVEVEADFIDYSDDDYMILTETIPNPEYVDDSKTFHVPKKAKIVKFMTRHKLMVSVERLPDGEG
jgi:hypothetical protein